MAQQKNGRNLGATNLHRSVAQSQSLLNVNDLETRAKATVKDIDELYAALQGLVPKKTRHNGGLGTNERKARSGGSGNDTDTAKSSEDMDGQPRFRRYHSEKYPKRQWRDNNMNLVPQKTSPRKPVPESSKPVSEARKPVLEKPLQDKKALEKTLSNERLFASDTEAELKVVTGQHPHLRRHFSLPEYEEEDDHMDETDGSHKRSRFLIFRRRRRPKTGKKKMSSWRTFFSTLSLKRHKSKKHGKSKIAPGVISTNARNENAARTLKHQGSNGSLPKEQRTPRTTPRPSLDVIQSIEENSQVRKSGRKKLAPEPPNRNHNADKVETLEPQSRERTDTIGEQSDLVQKKLSAWYKLAVRETTSLSPKQQLRATRSVENLLTDTEIIRKRGAFSSDTDSLSGTDRNRVNIPKTRVRKTRARRNRRRERGRFHSCPNVKMVTKALNEAEEKTDGDKLPEKLNTAAKDDLTDKAPQDSRVTTVKQVEARLSFGCSLGKEEKIADSIKLQNTNPRNWLARQCSKTTVGCIRPLQLNLFYSESPSRETVHRSRTTPCRPRAEGQESQAAKPHEFAFKIRRSSSRRRKRRSLKRGQTRLPHQSPFYIPPNVVNVARKDKAAENGTSSKESDLGSLKINGSPRSLSPNATNDWVSCSRSRKTPDGPRVTVIWRAPQRQVSRQTRS